MVSLFNKCNWTAKNKKTLNTIQYNATNKTIPPSLFTHPSLAQSAVFCNKFAERFTNKTTIRKTNIKETAGSHFVETLVLEDNLAATTVDSFKAAASPAINAIIENKATINPF